MTFKPMLAGKFDASLQRYPALVSPKLDGIRCAIIDGVATSRTLKPIPNKFVQAALRDALEWGIEGCDGELIVGDPTSPTAYRDTNSGVMALTGEPEFTYHVFDVVDKPNKPFKDRLPQGLDIRGVGWRVVSLLHEWVEDEAALLRAEEMYLSQGYEGLMVRDVEGLYKFGRSTSREGGLLKLKRMTTDEAVVIGVVEEMRNDNVATTNELGRTQRSSHQENKVGKGRMGALHVRDVKTGVEFHIGTGFSAAERDEMWASPPTGRIVSYNHFEIGRKDLPRFPSFKGFRNRIDMEAA